MAHVKRHGLRRLTQAALAATLAVAGTVATAPVASGQAFCTDDLDEIDECDEGPICQDFDNLSTEPFDDCEASTEPEPSCDDNFDAETVDQSPRVRVLCIGDVELSKRLIDVELYQDDSPGEPQECSAVEFSQDSSDEPVCSAEEEGSADGPLYVTTWELTVTNSDGHWWPGGSLYDLALTELGGESSDPNLSLDWWWLDQVKSCADSGGPVACVPSLDPDESWSVELAILTDRSCGFTNHAGLLSDFRQLRSPTINSLEAFDDVAEASRACRSSSPAPAPAPLESSIDVDISVSPAPANVGDVLTVSLSVTNDGESTLSNVGLDLVVGDGDASPLSLAAGYGSFGATENIFDGLVLAPGDFSATSTTYTVTDDDLGAPLRFATTGTGDYGSVTVTDSAATAVGILAPPAPSADPDPEPEPEPEPAPEPEPETEVLGEVVEREAPAPAPEPAAAPAVVETLPATGAHDAALLAFAFLLAVGGLVLNVVGRDPRRMLTPVRRLD